MACPILQMRKGNTGAVLCLMGYSLSAQISALPLSTPALCPPHSFTRSEGYSWALGCINSKKESRGYNLWQALLAMSDLSDLDF